MKTTANKTLQPTLVPRAADLVVGFEMMMNKQRTNPDQIINQGICVLCAVLGAIVALILHSVGLIVIPILAGGAAGLIAGLIVSKIRPRYGQDKGLWKNINHFVLTQMDLRSAFSRNKGKPNQ